MGLLRLALAGIWWRRGTSVLLLVVAVFTTTAAAAAPSYADSARDAILRAALRRAPVGEHGTGIEATSELVGRPSTAGLEAVVHDAFSGAAGRAYPSLVMQLSVAQRATDSGSISAPAVTVTSREGLCGEVRITSGTCVREADPTGVVVEPSAARAHDLHVGSRIGVSAPGGRGAAGRLVVRGIAARRDAAAGYWFGDGAETDADSASVWAPRSYFSGLSARAGDGIRATADLVLDRSRVHVGSVAGVSRAVGDAVRSLESGPSPPTVTTAVGGVVRSGLRGGSLLLLPIVVTIAELLALGWYLLHALIGGAAEARGAEVALTKVRGLTGGRTLLLVLLEPMLLLAAAVPLGVLLAAVAEHALVPRVLGDGVEVRLGGTAWAASAAAAAGGLAAAAAASVGVLRRPVLEQWRRTARSASRRGIVIEVVVVALAMAGVAQLRLSGSLTTGAAGGIALLAPMLLLVAGALVASRALLLLARLGFGSTRATGAVAAFVGLRQLVRRPAGRRTFGVLVVAVGIALYGLSSTVVTNRNRDERALTDVGAPVVLHIRPEPGTERRVRAVDPSGHFATAVAQVPVDVSTASGPFGARASTTAAPSLLVVDPDTFASVAYWRSDFGSAPLNRLQRPLAATAPVAPSLSGTRLVMTVSGRTVPPALTLAADLVDRRGDPIAASFGTLRRGSATYTSTVAGCTGGCTLRRIYVTRSDGSTSLLVARFTVHGIRVAGSGGTVPVRPSVDSVRWTPLNPIPAGQVRPAETVRTTSEGLDVSIAVSGAPGASAPGFGAVAGEPGPIPALVAADLLGEDGSLAAQTPDGAALDLRPAGRVSVVPRLGDAGAVVARDWLTAASPSGYGHALADQVWLGAGAPGDTVRRLREAGVRVLSVDTAVRRSTTLASQGPTFASALILAVGATAVVLAGFAVVLGLVLLARRRVFELSAMRSLGIRTSSLFGSVLVEQAALVLVATASGTALAILAAQLALPALPAYVDRPRFPAFVVDQPIGLLLAVAGAVAVLLLVAVAVTSAVLTRSAAVARLREAEQ